MATPNNMPANGSGGSAGTHDGHADCVPNIGRGFSSDSTEQTPGNNAARQYAKEHDLRGPAPKGYLEHAPNPVNQ